MPVVSSSFVPPVHLRNGHAQTVFGALRRGVAVEYRRERLELIDGDFVDLDWAGRDSDRVVILSHGLEGSTSDNYVRGMTAIFRETGWRVLAWNYRGCSGEPNRLPRAYHSGDTADLAAVVDRAARDASRVALVGFSLGGNVTLKYLGEAAPHSAIIGGVALSAPVHLASSARALDLRWANRMYLRRLTRRIVEKVRARADVFPNIIDKTLIKNVHGFADIDGRFTAPLHGFLDADDYWTRSSARQFLTGISVPTLLINAHDDPFLTPECFPEPEAAASRAFYLEAPPHGGHLGFLDGITSRFTWAERRSAEFLNALSVARSGA